MRHLDVTTDLKWLGYPNAVPDVDGGGDAIQHAIDHMVAHPGELRAVYLPPGVYRTTKPLIVGKPGDYVRVAMVSGVTGYPADGASARLISGARIELHGPNALTCPVLIVQGGRGCSFEGIQFVSAGNTAPHENATLAGLFERPEFDDWVSPHARTNRYSPQCVVAIDPFRTSAPDGDAANCYPGYELYYGGEWFPNPLASSDTLFRRCVFRGGVVGVAMSPTGGGMQNNENSVFEDCHWTYNAIQYSCGQSQARNTVLANPRMHGSWLAIDDGYIGPGGNAGVAPLIERGGNLGMTRYLFNLGLTTGTVHYRSLHIEATASLGKLGTGASGAQGGAMLSALTVSFATAAQCAPHCAEVPFHLATFGRVTLDTCELAAPGTVLRLWNADTGALVMRSCAIQAITEGGYVQAAFSRDDSRHLEHIQVRTPSGAVYQVAPPKPTVEVLNGGAPMTFVATSPRIATAQITTATGLAIGKTLRIVGASPYVPQTLDPSQHPYPCTATLGRVTSFDAASVTVEGLPYGFPLGVPVLVRTAAWGA